MNRILISACCALLLAASAFGQHVKSRCYTCSPQYAAVAATYVAPPSYTGKAQYQYSDWGYVPWETNTTYWLRARWVVYSATDKQLENDGWLYRKYQDGYTRVLPLADYNTSRLNSYPLQLGSTVYLQNPFKLLAAKTYGIKAAELVAPGQLSEHGIPEAVDVASLLGAPQAQSAISLESAAKAQDSALSAYQAITQAQIAKEREEMQIRGEIAKTAAASQATERLASQLKEFHAIAMQTAVVGAQKAQGEVAGIPIQNQALASVVSTKCFRCHGGADGVSGGVDFRLADKFDRVSWMKCYISVITGQMPKGGTKLSLQESELFDQMADSLRSGN